MGVAFTDREMARFAREDERCEPRKLKLREHDKAMLETELRGREDSKLLHWTIAGLRRRKVVSTDTGRRHGPWGPRPACSRTEAIQALGGRCACCGSVERLVLDHIVPQRRNRKLYSYLTVMQEYAWRPERLQVLCESATGGRRTGRFARAAYGSRPAGDGHRADLPLRSRLSAAPPAAEAASRTSAWASRSSLHGSRAPACLLLSPRPQGR